MTCGIYKITNKLNEKCYIGQSLDIERRWKQHCNRKGCTAIKNAIDKYGIENMTFEILEELPRDKSKLNESETHYIKLYDTISPNGYNLQTGGNSGLHCEETKEYLREINTGENNPMYGKSPWNRGKSPSEETRKKLSEANKGNQTWIGKKHTEETKKKQSEARKGKPSPIKGKKFNKETRKFE